MAELLLTGCRTTPLSGYLSALGLHRAVARTVDAEAEGYWQRGVYVLHSQFSAIEDLADALDADFQPESIVAPWNSGSGFAAKGTSPTAEQIIQWIRDSTDKRLEPLRNAVAGGDRVIEEAQRLGISDFWDKNRKQDVLRLCRNELPDAALAWLDAAIALGQDTDPSYSRLLGTGGNLGRQELSVTYLQQARTVLESTKSLDWLASALDGRQRAPLPKDSPGQFDAGGVGAPDEPNSVGNPWTFLFLIEGTLLFATAVVRRYGSAYAKAALPFQVAGSTAGFASSATDERPLAEQWAPEWSEAMRVPDIAHLLGEGRADWNSHTARSGLDMARAAATLGVDRGISAFHRHVFVNRLGRSPIAVPADRIEVGVRGGVDLLARLDRWRDALQKGDLSAYISARLRALDQAIYDHARCGQASALAEVFAALGRCRAAASRSGKVRAADLPELRLADGAKIFDHLRGALDNERELRIALAVATSHDEQIAFRTWLEEPLLAGGLAAGLADIARRRSFPLATDETVRDRTLSVRGARIAFERGMRLRSGDIMAFVEGGIDDDRTAALILGLSCVDWRYAGSKNLPGVGSPPDPAFDLLLLFTSAKPLPYTSAEGNPQSLFVRPDHEWAAQLIAGHIPDVLLDASRRLRIAGLRHVVTVPDAPYDGTRLAAALLLHATEADRRTALNRVAVVGTHRTTPIKEATA
jgi:CRISPR-associated protein Csx17